MRIYEERIKDLQYLLKRRKLDAIVVTRPAEVGFLTGFHLEHCSLLITRSDAFAFTIKMLISHFSNRAPFVEAYAVDDINSAVIKFAKKNKLKKTIFEPETVKYLEGIFWKKNGFLEKEGLTAELRLTKKGAELGALKKSCVIAAQSFPIIRKKIKKGRSEISVAGELEDIMQSKGATGNSFNLIVAFGENSALPHHESSERKLKNNEAVLIDYGCVYDFYCSDMTRTFFFGRPDAEFRKVHSIVAAAQKKGVKAIKDGVKAFAIDKIARDHISDSGYGQYFIHGTGHGVGLEIHESPFLNTKSKAVLKAGMVVTVEPGIYLEGKFGVRIEDSVLVKKSGYDVLTK